MKIVSLRYFKNQGGFTGFEIILVGLVLASVGSAGFFAYQSRQDKSDYSVNIPKKVKTASTTNSAKIDDSKAAQTALEFYTTYVDSAHGHMGDKAFYDNLVRRYGTDNLVALYGKSLQYDPILCSQQFPNQKPTVVSHQTSADTAKVVIRTVFSESGNLDIAVTVNSKYLIDTVSCPNPA